MGEGLLNEGGLLLFNTEFLFIFLQFLIRVGDLTIKVVHKDLDSFDVLDVSAWEGQMSTVLVLMMKGKDRGAGLERLCMHIFNVNNK